MANPYKLTAARYGKAKRFKVGGGLSQPIKSAINKEVKAHELRQHGHTDMSVEGGKSKGRLDKKSRSVSPPPGMSSGPKPDVSTGNLKKKYASGGRLALTPDQHGRLGGRDDFDREMVGPPESEPETPMPRPGPLRTKDGTALGAGDPSGPPVEARSNWNAEWAGRHPETSTKNIFPGHEEADEIKRGMTPPSKSPNVSAARRKPATKAKSKKFDDLGRYQPDRKPFKKGGPVFPKKMKAGAESGVGRLEKAR